MEGKGVAVEVEGLVAGYRRRPPALAGVTFRAEPGEVLVVVGPNGAGKTTLFRALLGFVLPLSGSIRLGDLPPGAFRRDRGVGYLPETPGFPPGWSGMAVLREAVRLCGVGDPAAAMEQAVAVTGLSRGALLGDMESMSKGMARRVGVAAMMAGDPAILLLDEPLNGLDIRSRAALREEIRRRAERGATVLMASHELAEVERTADRVLVLREGRSVRSIRAGELSPGALETLALADESRGRAR